MRPHGEGTEPGPRNEFVLRSVRALEQELNHQRRRLNCTYME